MNKTDLICIVSEKTGLGKNCVEHIINATLDTISDSLVKGENVKVYHFGNFNVKYRAERIGRNPHTQEAVTIPGKRIPVFVPSTFLKDQLA